MEETFMRNNRGQGEFSKSLKCSLHNVCSTEKLLPVMLVWSSLLTDLQRKLSHLLNETFFLSKQAALWLA